MQNSHIKKKIDKVIIRKGGLLFVLQLCIPGVLSTFTFHPERENDTQIVLQAIFKGQKQNFYLKYVCFEHTNI